MTDYHEFDSEGECVSDCARCAYLGIARKAHYHAGHNVSGYLPMSDESYSYETFTDAMSALQDELTRAWDSDADALYVDGYGQDARVNEEYGAARQAMREATAPAFCTYTPTNFESEHDIPTAWWVTPCTDEECSAGDEE